MFPHEEESNWLTHVHLENKLLEYATVGSMHKIPSNLLAADDLF